MKWIRVLTTCTALLGMSVSAQAGLFSFGGKCGAEKCCGATRTCQPRCCKPTIQRPCEPKTFTYQRAVSNLVKPCCKPDNCCPKKPSCCAPAAKCAPACAPKAADCAAPCDSKCAPKAAACAPACAPKAANCAAPCASKCAPACGPKAATCAAPCNSKCAPACGPKDKSCAAPCDSKCAPKCAPACGPKKACCGDDRCCPDQSCEIAELIYESQTACYAKHRAKAIDRLGDRYNCVCNPEIMCAFVYALNDCDERVRHEAADEIGDQVRRNGCCCMNDKVVEALTAALADCDRGVRNEAEEALEVCGYEVVDCCKPKCGAAKCGAGCKPAGPACDPACHAPGAAPAAPTKADPEAAPAPAPPEEKSARSLFPIRRNSKLANLFGLLD